MRKSMERARVTRRGAERWRRGHPWIYRSDVVEPPAAGPSGVVVESETGETLGTALWSPASTISLRMLTRDVVSLDERFWSERVSAALRHRRSLGLPATPGRLPASAETTAYRVVHAEADGLPSLIVDRFDQYLVVQLLSAGLEAYRDTLVAVLRRHLEPEGILARNDVPVRQHEDLPRTVEELHGRVPEEVEVREYGVRYLAALRTGQKTGAFLDQRENRHRAALLARGRALDCFAYHGSFALHLAAGGADEVIAVDSSGEALARALENARLNGMDRIRAVEANVFDFLRAEEASGREYDIIVLDPPAFAKRRDAVPQALRGYKEINLRAMRLLAPGGYLCTFSCSYHVSREAFRAMLVDAAEDSGRAMRWVEARDQAPDHPEVLQIPETGYLKGAILQAADS